MPCDDCSRTESCPPCPEDGKCRCGPDEACGDCPETPEEPPLTPEEEEQAPEDAALPCTCGAVGEQEHDSDCDANLTPYHGEHGYPEGEEPPPPQPDRRPPYVVAYSVQGHLFEVALSGDATVRAVDGALVIQHHLGPIAGIVQVLPVLNERSADGAEADQ